jgi:mannose-6-phosphate isomerase-like protein (cupin superfamily)
MTPYSANPTVSLAADRKESGMPKMSKASAANVEEFGPGKEWHDDLDGYKASFVEVSEDTDLTPLLQGLPNDQCYCPHWGYVLTGRMWFRTDAGEESYGPGDAYYVPAGHTAGANAGSEFLIFSPSEQIAEVEAHMMRRAQELQSA